MNLFNRTIQGQATRVPPIWMMRQAGRYHAHYQNLRAQHSFMDLCLVPELAAEVAMGPVQDFDFDAAILFSDLLFPFMALGQGLEYTEQGPRLGFQLNPDNIKKLKPWDAAISEMEFQKKAMQLTRSRLPEQKGLIGFVGGFWTLYVYSVEGSHAGSLTNSKKLIPQLWSQFMEIMRPFIRANIQLQLQGGADIVMIFDTAAGELSPALYDELILPELEYLTEAYPYKLGYYSKHTTPDHFTNPRFKNLKLLGCGFDHRFNLTERLQNKTHRFVQGNFDQSLLHMDTNDFLKVFKSYLQNINRLSPEQRAGWICGLGHGVLPKTPEKNVKLFVESAREFFA